MDISHPDCGEGRPTLYNCAFTMGTETSVSAKEFADCSIYEALEIDSGTFLISSDIASWPRLQIARSGKFITATKSKYWVLMCCVGYSGYYFFGTALLIITCRHKPYVLTGVLMLAIGGFFIPLVMSFVKCARDTSRRKKEYVRWVESFAITGLN